MARKKQQKFARVAASPHSVEPGKPFYGQIKGRWAAEQFGNAHPITLELACGRGEYTVGLAEVFPERNFVGVDLKGDRLWKGCVTAEEKGLHNAAFLRCHIQNLHEHFAPQEVSEIWIIHPDPRPKQHDARRRLTHPRFLAMYRWLMVSEGWLHLKTDDAPLFEWSLEMLEEFGCQDLELTRDLYRSPLWEDHYGIITRYERMFHEGEGRDIHYLRCRLTGEGGIWRPAQRA